MDKIAIKDCDIIFLSYDEPNCEKNYADLVRKVPWAKRIHGVHGSDTAHKACGELSSTHYFMTVDGDTQLDPKILDMEINLKQMGMDDTWIFSWCGHINVNGLRYGNGSLKLWTKDFVKTMKTHENFAGQDSNEIEFCFFKNLFQFNENFSTSYVNATPKQAWRAGFREGVKMSINKNVKIKSKNELWWQNVHRLCIWMTVGCDVENGIYSILGAREACNRIFAPAATPWDFTEVKDFKKLEDLWISSSHGLENNQQILDKICFLGNNIKKHIDLDFPTHPLMDEQSDFFKKVYINTPRTIRKTI